MQTDQNELIQLKLRNVDLTLEVIQLKSAILELQHKIIQEQRGAMVAEFNAAQVAPEPEPAEPVVQVVTKEKKVYERQPRKTSSKTS